MNIKRDVDCHFICFPIEQVNQQMMHSMTSQHGSSVVSTPTGECMPHPFQNIEQPGMHSHMHTIKYIRIITIISSLNASILVTDTANMIQQQQQQQQVHQQLQQQSNSLTYSDAVKLPIQVK